MKFSLDTDRYDKMKLTLTKNDCENDLTEVITDFCYGIASFFVDFAMKLECNTSQAEGLKAVCLSCIEKNIDIILEEGALEPEKEEKSEKELAELKSPLITEGFSEQEIYSIIQLVKDCGNLTAATKLLKSVVKSMNRKQ